MRIIASIVAASFGALTFHLGVLALGAPYAADATLALDEGRLALVRSGRIEVESLIARNVVLSFPDTEAVVRIRATGPSADAAEAAAIAAGRVIALRLEQAEVETLRARAAMLREELMRVPAVTGSVAREEPGSIGSPRNAAPDAAVREALAAARTPADLERIAGRLPPSLAAAQSAYAEAVGWAESAAAIYGPRHPSLRQAQRRAELAGEQLMAEAARVAAAPPLPVAATDVVASPLVASSLVAPPLVASPLSPLPEPRVSFPAASSARAPSAMPGLSEALETLASAPQTPRGAVLDGAAAATPIATARLAAIPAGAAFGLFAGMVLAGGARPSRLRAPTGTWRSASRPIQFEAAEPVVEPVSDPTADTTSEPAAPVRASAADLRTEREPEPSPEIELDVDPYPIDALLDGYDPADGATLVVEDADCPGRGDVLAVRLALRFVTAGRRVLIVDSSAQGLIARALDLRCDEACLQIVRIPSRSGVCALLPLSDLAGRAQADWRCERAVQSLALLRGGYDLVVLRAPSLEALAAPVFASVSAIFTVDEAGEPRLILPGARAEAPDEADARSDGMAS